MDNKGQPILWITQILEKRFTTRLNTTSSLLEPQHIHRKNATTYYFKKFLYLLLKLLIMVYNSICCTILNRSNIYPHSLLQLTIGRMYVSTSCGFLFRYDNALKVNITYGNYNKHFKHFIVETSTVHTCQCMLLLGK